jgi:serine/threonine protein phosphatase PrpC
MNLIDVLGPFYLQKAVVMSLLNILFRRHAQKPSESGPAADTTTAPLVVTSHGGTDRGLVRQSNEDCFAIVELTRTMHVHQTNLPQPALRASNNRGHFFLVADGVGGNAVGEVASSLSIESIEDFLLHTLRRFSNLRASEEQNALKELQTALSEADNRIFSETDKHPEWRGMGTTMTMAFVVNSRLFIAHAGDSRCYLLSRDLFHQLTQDHTFLAELVKRGIVTDPAPRHPFRNIVSNILGGDQPGVRAELHNLDIHAGDVLLLCSDGLTDMVPDEKIAAILRQEKEPKAACTRLIAQANAKGGKDNITAIVVHFNN